MQILRIFFYNKRITKVSFMQVGEKYMSIVRECPFELKNVFLYLSWIYLSLFSIILLTCR
jgi:hypothetical protein